MDDLSKYPASMEIYKTIFETWRSQVDSWWQRSNYFAAFEIAALAGCWHLVEFKHPWTGLLGSILGISLTIVWWSSNSAVHSYVDYWWASIRKIEQKLSLQDEGFDFVCQHPGGQGWVRYSRLVQIVPGLFMAAWIVLVGYEFYHVCPAAGKGPLTELSFLRRWLNAIGLIFGMVGVVFIFIWGPPQPSFRGDVLLLESTDENALGAKKARYKLMSRVGLAFIFMGFLFQFVSEIVLTCMSLQ